MAINAFGAVLTAIVLAIVVYEKFAGGAWLVVILIPLIVGRDAVHQPPVRGLRAAPRAPARVRRPAAAARGAGHRPRPVDQPGHRPRGQRRALDRHGRDRRLHQRGPGGLGGDARGVGPPRAGRAAGHRREPVPRARRSAGRLPRRARPGLAAGQAPPDHVRRDPGVRRPPLVGADPLQPVGAPPAVDPARPAAHGRRRRAVPAGRQAGRRPGRCARPRRPRHPSRPAPTMPPTGRSRKAGPPPAA